MGFHGIFYPNGSITMPILITGLLTCILVEKFSIAGLVINYHQMLEMFLMIIQNTEKTILRLKTKLNY